MSEYVVKVQVSDKDVKKTPVEETRKEQLKQSETPQKKEVKNQSNDTLALLKRVTTVYALGMQAAQLGVGYMSNQYLISGETLKAERLNTRFNNTKKGITTVGMIGLSLATGNPLVIAATAYNLAQQAFNLGLENQRFVARLNVEKERSAYYTERLVKNISEVR